jgi:hypothetical protein
MRAEPAAAKGRTDLFESMCFDIVELQAVYRISGPGHPPRVAGNIPVRGW